MSEVSHKPAPCVIVPAALSVNRKELRNAVALFTANKASEAMAHVIGERDLARTPELLPVSVTLIDSANKSQRLAFEITQVNLDVSDVNAVLLRCKTELIGALLTNARVDYTDELNRDYYVLVVEPTLHFEDMDNKATVQAVACVIHECTSHTREALTALLAVA